MLVLEVSSLKNNKHYLELYLRVVNLVVFI